MDAITSCFPSELNPFSSHCRPEVLKLWNVPELSGGLSKHRLLGYLQSFAFSRSWIRNALEMRISTRFPGNAEAVGQGLHFENHCSGFSSYLQLLSMLWMEHTHFAWNTLCSLSLLLRWSCRFSTHITSSGKPSIIPSSIPKTGLGTPCLCFYH